jgi:drug/metabolite transporter (DMT)-like permease
MPVQYLLGSLFCLIATISWGCMFPVMTQALKYVDPFNFTAIRYSIAVIAFLIVLLAKEGVASLSLRKERFVLAWLFGTAGFAGFGFLVFLGQKLSGPTGALTASIMMATMPLLSLLVNWLMRGIKPPPVSIALIVLSFIGVVTVITKGDIFSIVDGKFQFFANASLILGALCWVIYTTGASFFPTWSPYRYTTITTLLGLVSVFVIDAVLIASGYIAIPAQSAIVFVVPHLLYTALIAGFVGVLCWNLGNRIVTPVNGVLFMDVVPLTAFVVSALTGTVPARPQILGALISASALILNNLYQRRRLSAQSALTMQKAKA